MFWTQSEKNIWVVGHRGMRAHYPENTMLSFKKAIETGVDGIETDIHMTADGQLILMHDTELTRTTNGTGNVEAYTFAELQELDAGIKFSAEFAGQKVPLFEDLLKIIDNPAFMLNVEMKDYRKEAIDRTVALLKKYDFSDRCVIACFNAEVTTYVHERYGMKTQGFPAHMVKKFSPHTEEHYYSVGIGMDDLTPGLCADYRVHGIDPWCWCPDTEEAVEKAIRSTSSLYTCNAPEVALGILRKRGLHA